MKDNEVKGQNQQAWDQNVANNVGWTVPVDSEVITKARKGEFSHTLESIIGGQLSAGFVIDQFYEESSGKELGNYFNDYFATRAIKAEK